MTPKTFVVQVKSAVVEENSALYKGLFESTSPEQDSNAYWKRALTLHRSLSESDQAVLFEIMRQITIDTVSNLFGILDGVSALKGHREDFVLTTKSDSQKINGDLQDLFLESVEGDRQ